jgi:Trk K+ transport system NAD-binding subunit
MNGTPLILVVGGDALTERVCAEIASTAGHEVSVLWPITADCDDALKAAGVEHAASILALSNDDGLNLAVALRARMLNRGIRVVLRQFNPLLGTKIEQNLPDCTVLSPAAHSAATYAGAALDPGCFFALRFPTEDGPLLGFTSLPAGGLGVAGLTVFEGEARSGLRILAVGDRLDPPGGAAIGADDRVVAFGRVVERRASRQHAARQPTAAKRRGFALRDVVAAWHRINPVLRLLITCAVVFFTFSFGFFHFALHKTLTAASFYVVETMTNVGFGDASVTRYPIVTFGAIVAMLGGIVFTSIFIGYVSSALTRAQWISMQGLRRIRAHGHIVICGGGKIGSAVVNLLTAAGKRVVVIEPNPDPSLVRRARERDVDLLTGDAHRDDALDLCDIPNASAVLALTDNDAINLEIALGVRARSGEVPLVVRMENDAFASATSAIFGIATFSPAALTAPALAGLSRFPGTRGRVQFAGDDHTIGQRRQGELPQKPPAEVCVPLCVWRGGQVMFIRDFAEMQGYDDLLFTVPLGQFRRSQTSRVTIATSE